MRKSNLLKRMFAVALCAALVGGTALAAPLSSENNSIKASAYWDENGEWYEDSEEGESQFSYDYNDDNTVTILGYYGSDSDVVIPSMIDGMPVTTISGGAFSYTEITSVSFPDTLKTIDGSAFYCCNSLTSVSIPDSVEVLYDYAFGECANLVSVNIGNGVKAIGNSAFYRCNNLTSVVIGNGVTSIGSFAFEECSSLSVVNFGNKVQSIGENAFEECTSLENISLPDSVETINRAAFSGCTSLSSIDFGSGVNIIGSSAFSGCTALSSVTLPDSLKTLGDYAFDSCESLSDIQFGNGIEELGNWVFSGTDWYNNLPYGDVYVGKIYYKYKYQYTDYYYDDEDIPSFEVTVKDGTVKIADSAFENCYGLTKVTLPSSVKYIGERAFEHCYRLTDLTLPSSLEYIGNYAFRYCNKLNNQTLPETLTHIGDYAFTDCGAMTSVVIPDSVTELGEGVFNSCGSLKTATVGAGVNSLDLETFSSCSSLQSITVSANNENYSSVNGLVYSKDKTSLVICPQGKKGVVNIQSGVTEIGNSSFSACTGITNVIIPDTVETLGDYAFGGCSGLTRITLGSGIKTIGDGAFRYCSALTSVTIPDSVTSIGNYAFEDCNSLEGITVGSGISELSSNIFSGCNNLTSFTVSENNNYYASVNGILYNKGKTVITICPKGVSGNLTIPEGVTTISNNTFNDCDNITGVVLPNSLTSIGSYAFAYCDNLKTVTFGNSLETIGYDAFCNCDALESVTLPDSLTSIGSEAFESCNNLASVTFGNGLKTIGYEAFEYCEALTSINIPDSVETIEDEAFQGCSALETVTIGSGVSSLTSGVFYGCNSLRTITLSPSNNYYKSVDGVLYNKDMTQIVFCPKGVSGVYTIPSGVTAITGSTFSGCNGLTGIIIPDSVETIESSAFSQCDNLQTVTFGNGLKSIGRYAFYDCDSLKTVTIPDSVETIDEYAFEDCSSLETVNIGSGVKNMGYNAFYGCQNLKKLTIAEGTTSIGSYSFAYCTNLEDVTLPSTLTSVGSNSFDDTKWIKTLSGSDIYFGKVLYKVVRDETTAGSYTVKIKEGTTSISPYAFRGCKGLTSVVIPDTVTNIGHYAFYGCDNLKSVKIPASVTYIGTRAFGYSYKLVREYYYDDEDEYSYAEWEDEVKLDDFKILGTTGTAASIYANANNILFESLLLENNSSVSADKVKVKGYITMTASAQGGSPFNKNYDDDYYENINGPSVYYKYAFYYRKLGDANWSVKGTEFGEENTAVLNPGTATTYEIMIKVKDRNDNVVSKSFVVDVYSDSLTLNNNSKVSATKVKPGTEVKITGAASGGSGSYKYAFYYKKGDQTDWTLKGTAFGSDTSVTLKPATETKYDVLVKVKDSSGTIRSKIMTVDVTNNLPLTNNSTINATDIKLGNSIVMTGSADGGAGNYKFAFYYKKKSDSYWTLKGTEFGSDTTATITPGTAVPYEIMIKVKDENGSVEVKNFDVNVSENLTNISTVSATNAMIGDTIVITGAAKGGSGSYKYAFYYKKGSETNWTLKGTAFGDDKVVYLNPGLALTYQVKVIAKDSEGNTQTKTFSINVTKTLINNSKVSSTSVKVGGSVTITGAAEGGTAPYKYAFYFKKGDAQDWTLKGSEFGSDTSVKLNPATATTYKILVKVKDATGRIIEKEMTVNVAEADTALVNNSKVSATSVKVNTAVTLTGAAEGGTGSYKYAYYFRKKGDADWKVKGTEFGTATTATLTPGTETTYEVKIVVKDASGKTAEKSFEIKVGETETALVNNSKVSATSVKVNTAVTLTGAASGGTGPYTYAYYFRKKGDADWKVKGTEFGTATTATLTPGTATTYQVKIVVKDSKGKTAEKSFEINVGQAEQTLVNNSKVSATSVKVNTTVTLTGAASGGTGPYTFAFYFRKKGDADWKVKGTEFGTATTATLTPGTATTYQVKIIAKDSKSKTAEKMFNIEVK